MARYEIYKYENLIEQCRLIKQKDDYLSKSTGYNFNIFSILDRERYEVTTHSYFLYELLNKNGSHGQGTKFLEIFLNNILPEGSDYGDISKTHVARESLTINNMENRRIDFVIECENIIIGIEMKIDASDQDAQLFDYHNELCARAKNKYGSNKKVKLYYLTLNGTDASGNSIKTLEKDDIINISFSNIIYRWIEQCMESCVSVPILRDALYQYLILIEKLTGKKESVVTDIGKLLLKEDNLSIAINMKSAIEYASKEIQKKFWKALKLQLPKFIFVDYKFKESDTVELLDRLVDEYFNLPASKRYSGLKYDLFEIDDENKVSFYIELHDTLTYGLTISRKNKSGKYVRGEFSIKGNAENLKKNFTGGTGVWWITNKSITCRNVNFYNFNNFTDDSTINKNLDENIKEFVECLSRKIMEELQSIKEEYSELYGEINDNITYDIKTTK